MILYGACHCGQVEVAFETAMPVADLPLRACSCSFCRRHGTKAVADPNGRLTISAPPNGLSRYRFGLRTADYLICRTCGAYVAAVISGNGEERATLNVTPPQSPSLRTAARNRSITIAKVVEDRRARRLDQVGPRAGFPASASGGRLGRQTTMPTNILMPALSPTMEKGNLARWLKKEGDKVKSGDVIAEIETDKATMEYEAVDEGTLAKIVVPEGTPDVPVNQVIAVLAGEGEDVKAAAAGAGEDGAASRHLRRSRAGIPLTPSPPPTGRGSRPCCAASTAPFTSPRRGRSRQGGG